MIDEFFDNIDVDLFDNMATQLDCTVPQCDLGDGGARWRTPALSENNAMKYLESHGTYAHGCKVPAWSYPSSSLSEIPRPTLSGRYSREDFDIFKVQWDVYMRYYGRVAKTEDDIKNQLFSCLGRAISAHMYVYFGPEISNTTVEEMLLLVKFFTVMEGEQATCDTHSAVVSTTHATELEISRSMSHI